ncbi:unnamed protein product [Lactuca saligna]|uniref:Myb/SANT-like domain-containing protein n=1 Tax=Lactuca saligna TaxID=75948 RepID=A0AA36EIS6_LACSI|nr:unnamed protein product [Lactuca saligna]
MQFIYVLPGWEGSAANGRILCSATLRENGLQVAKGNYYLVDAEYTNGEGFLTPFRGQRYHLNTWLNGHRPEKAEEYFNMKHSSKRNVIERCFGVLKKDGLYLEVHHSIPFSHKSQTHGERGPGKNKRKLNEIEDAKLIESMVDILNSGSHFKVESGIKPGFFGVVETRLVVSLPNSGIKAKPHIKSRIKTLKRDRSVVHDMMSWNNTNGFGWDDQNNMLEAPQSVWQAYAQVHKNASKWRGKKFPHYWDLCIVFGKDRANGRDAQTAADIVSEINNKQEENIDYMQGT